MNLNHQSPVIQKYHVHVGHTHMTVEGRSRDEAIRQARQQLCLEIPRLWDVIQRIEDTRFVVDPLP